MHAWYVHECFLVETNLSFLVETNLITITIGLRLTDADSHARFAPDFIDAHSHAGLSTA